MKGKRLYNYFIFYESIYICFNKDAKVLRNSNNNVEPKKIKRILGTLRQELFVSLMME